MALPSDEAARPRAVAGPFTGLVRGTTDWDAPAPVDGWVARDVVEHLVTWLTGLLAAHGVDLPSAPDDAGPVARWEAHVVAVQSLLDDPASRDRLVQDPHFPEMSLTQIVDRLRTTDVFMHTWDLARAVGQQVALDADHGGELLAGMAPMEPMLRASGQYGPRVEVPEDADPQTRLVAGLVDRVGRDDLDLGAQTVPPTASSDRRASTSIESSSHVLAAGRVLGRYAIRAFSPCPPWP